MKRIVAGVDIGGTNQTVAVAAADGRILDKCRLHSASGATAAELVTGVTAALDDLLSSTGAPLSRIGVGFGGPVDFERGAILTSHHVAAWDSYPLVEQLSTRFGVPVILDNDANAGALGEARFGAGMGHPHLIYLNIGTGIGAGLVLNGSIYRGGNGLAGEIGHITVNASPDARLCPCGKRGCLEAYASGRSIGERAGQPGQEVMAAARRGDLPSLAIIQEAAAYLGLALAGVTNTLDPSAIVIGGGVSEVGEILLAPLRVTLRAHLIPGMPVPLVLPAALGYDAGVTGAVAPALDT
ncbi:MAG TPA: ROK family protein [Chloroflexota bacterium]|nr:ROK family protein [Chloroflexota bacterium]